MTKFKLICAAGAIALMAAACTEREEEPAVPPADEMATPPADAMTPAPVPASGTALGMTSQQLEAADIVTADGADLGDVERVVTDDAGVVTGLAVGVGGATDTFVVVPIDGLTTTADGDVQTTMTAEALAALPAWTPPAM